MNCFSAREPDGVELFCLKRAMERHSNRGSDARRERERACRVVRLLVLGFECGGYHRYH